MSAEARDLVTAPSYSLNVRVLVGQLDEPELSVNHRSTETRDDSIVSGEDLVYVSIGGHIAGHYICASIPEVLNFIRLALDCIFGGEDCDLSELVFAVQYGIRDVLANQTSGSNYDNVLGRRCHHEPHDFEHVCMVARDCKYM